MRGDGRARGAGRSSKAWSAQGGWTHEAVAVWSGACLTPWISPQIQAPEVGCSRNKCAFSEEPVGGARGQMCKFEEGCVCLCLFKVSSRVGPDSGSGSSCFGLGRLVFFLFLYFGICLRGLGSQVHWLTPVRWLTPRRWDTGSYPMHPSWLTLSQRLWPCCRRCLSAVEALRACHTLELLLCPGQSPLYSP